MDIDKTRLGNGPYLLLVFMNQELAHKSWVAEGSLGSDLIAPYFKKLEIKDNVLIIEETSTNPKYRGKGIYLYVYKYLFDYAKSLDKHKVIYSTSANNAIVKAATNKLNTKVSYRGYHVKYFWLFDYYYLKNIAGGCGELSSNN